MIFSSEERKKLYKALAIIEEVVVSEVELWEQKLPNYKIWIEYTDRDDIKIMIDEVPKFMTMLQALYLAKKLIATVLNADEMRKLKRWIEE